MSLSHELVWQQLRQLSFREWRTVHSLSQRGRHRWHYSGSGERYTGGHDPQRNGQSEAETLDANRIIPFLHIWLRLRTINASSASSSASSTAFRCWQRNNLRLRLQQRPVLQNLRQVISVHLNRFHRMFFATPEHNRWPVIRSQQENWQRRLIKKFNSISMKLDLALTHVGPMPRYVNTSAAMEVMNFSAVSEQLNSALVKYLVDDDEYMKTPSIIQLDCL